MKHFWIVTESGKEAERGHWEEEETSSDGGRSSKSKVNLTWWVHDLQTFFKLFFWIGSILYCDKEKEEWYARKGTWSFAVKVDCSCFCQEHKHFNLDITSFIV